MNVMQQTACLVVNPISVAVLFYCTPAGRRASDLLMETKWLKWRESDMSE